MVRVFIDEPSQGFAGRPPMPQALKHPQLPHRSGQAALDSLAQERQPGVDLRRVNAPSQQAGARHRQDPKCQSRRPFPAAGSDRTALAREALPLDHAAPLDRSRHAPARMESASTSCFISGTNPKISPTKSGLGHHVWDRWTGRQRTQLQAQVAGSLIGIDRAIPAPNRAVVQTQLV